MLFQKHVKESIMGTEYETYQACLQALIDPDRGRLCHCGVKDYNTGKYFYSYSLAILIYYNIILYQIPSAINCNQLISKKFNTYQFKLQLKFPN